MSEAEHAETDSPRLVPTLTATICSASCIYPQVRAAGPAASTLNSDIQAYALGASPLSGVLHTASTWCGHVS